MQVTKGTWRMREQCVPGSLSSAHAQEPGNEARWQRVRKRLKILFHTSLVPRPCGRRKTAWLRLPTSFGKSVRYEVPSFACLTVSKTSWVQGGVATPLSC